MTESDKGVSMSADSEANKLALVVARLIEIKNSAMSNEQNLQLVPMMELDIHKTIKEYRISKEGLIVFSKKYRRCINIPEMAKFAAISASYQIGIRQRTLPFLQITNLYISFIDNLGGRLLACNRLILTKYQVIA